MKRVRLAIKLSAFALSVAFLRMSLSESIPLGVYLAQYQPVHRGDMAVVCPPQRVVDEERRVTFTVPGFCYGSLPMFKFVAAVGGDVIDVSDKRIAINGVAWPHSARRWRDRAGRPITRWLTSGTVPVDRILVLGSHPQSFDGRTFGLIPAASVREKLHPLLTSKG